MTGYDITLLEVFHLKSFSFKRFVGFLCGQRPHLEWMRGPRCPGRSKVNLGCHQELFMTLVSANHCLGRRVNIHTNVCLGVPCSHERQTLWRQMLLGDLQSWMQGGPESERNVLCPFWSFFKVDQFDIATELS